MKAVLRPSDFQELIKVNIWSHLLGSVAFGLLAGIASFSYLQRYPSSSEADIAVFACFFGGAVTCLGLSATVHISLRVPTENYSSI
jgi:predicted membrane channel-forming protein YqfA (hemolysin III family)